MRFSLKTMFVTSVAAIIAFSIAYQWYSYPQRRYERVQASLRATGAGKLEAAVLYDPKQQIGPLPRHHVGNLLELHFEGTKVQDSDLKHVEVLDPENLLQLSGTNITDAGLQHLYGLRVKTIVLTDTDVTPDGIAKLRKQLPKGSVVEY
ncbi:MAG: hypothetical protein AAFN77_02600 [Planctomycetota bacterium]